MSKLRTLWRGDYSLADAFWMWAVTVGLIVNGTTSLFFLMMIAGDQPWVAVILGYGVSLPYNVVAIVGVWRAAARYEGPIIYAVLARGTTLFLMVVLSLT